MVNMRFITVNIDRMVNLLQGLIRGCVKLLLQIKYITTIINVN